MTPRETLQKLESLLERVRRNAAKGPRVVAVAAAPVADRRAPREEPPTPVPAPVVEAPVPPPSVRAPVVESPAPAPVELAPPVAEPPPPPPVVEAPPPAPPAPSWQAERPSTVQPRPSSLPPEELSDDDLLEVTTIPPEADDSVEVEVAMPEAAEPEHDEPPVSSSRSKVAETIDQALASAAEMEEEREVPVKTPPPESGPQAAGPPPQSLEPARVPDVEALEAELAAAQEGPTAEQLGETIELEPARGPSLEIDVSPPVAPAAERPVEELEVTLPRAQMPSGTYDLPTSAPAPSPPAPPVEERRAESSAPPEPRPTARPELGAAEIARVVLARASQSQSFLDVLDRSMTL